MGAPNTVAITVKRIVEDYDGKPAMGVCSNFLCDLAPGAKIHLAGPFGAIFLMPDDPAAILVMICTGTGIAPMRAMIERRRRVACEAGMTLFYGGRTSGEMPYLEDLQALSPSFLDLNIALSRQPGQSKVYAQDLIGAKATRIAALLQNDNTYFYICGSKGVERGVLDAFQNICMLLGLDWPAIRQDIANKARLHIEVY